MDPTLDENLFTTLKISNHDQINNNHPLDKFLESAIKKEITNIFYLF